MTRILLDFDDTKKDIFDFAIKIIKYLSEKNCDTVTSKKFCCDKNNKDKKIDYVLALGGDGTLLSCSRRYAKFNKPIMGINLGHLGYLTSAEKSNAFFALDNLLSENYRIEKRTMLQTENINQKITALNDICIKSSLVSRLISFDLFINNNLIDKYKADGIIISTPTGSTAYNLSAGGPIIKPTLPVFVLTPICAHTLYSRPILISDSDSIKILLDKHSYAQIILDGQKTIKAPKKIKIKKSDLQTKIIKTGSVDFYDIVRKKLFR